MTFENIRFFWFFFFFLCWIPNTSQPHPDSASCSPQVIWDPWSKWNIEVILKLFNASLRWETHSAQYTGLLEHGGHCPTIRTRSKSGCLLNVSTGKGYLQSSLQPVLSSPVALVQNLGAPTHPRTVLPDCPANALIVYQPADGLIDHLPLATCSNRGLGARAPIAFRPFLHFWHSAFSWWICRPLWVLTFNQLQLHFLRSVLQIKSIIIIICCSLVTVILVDSRSHRRPDGGLALHRYSLCLPQQWQQQRRSSRLLQHWHLIGLSPHTY